MLERVPNLIYVLAKIGLTPTINIPLAKSMLQPEQWQEGPLPVLPVLPSIIHATLAMIYHPEESFGGFILDTAAEICMTTIVCLLLNPLNSEVAQTTSLAILSTIALIGTGRTAWEVYQAKSSE